MTKKHFTAFADYIAELRRLAKECCNMEAEAELALEQANACEGMVIEVAKEFNPKFDKEKFVTACQRKS